MQLRGSKMGTEEGRQTSATGPTCGAARRAGATLGHKKREEEEEERASETDRERTTSSEATGVCEDTSEGEETLVAFSTTREVEYHLENGS